MKKYANDPSTIPVIVAGNGTGGSDVHQLNNPVGIFVDTKLSLYVADSGNHRVQRFQFGHRDGETVAGNGASSTITLNDPCAVVLDGDDYLFIVDRGNHRIVASGLGGFRCIAGCTETNGSASNQLLFPMAIGLDSSGNIFVADGDNQRIQKFLGSPMPCGKLSKIAPIRSFYESAPSHFRSFHRGFVQSTEIQSLCKMGSKGNQFSEQFMARFRPYCHLREYEQFCLCQRER